MSVRDQCQRRAKGGRRERTVVHDLARHGGQSGELVCRNLRVLPSESTHERTLPYRGESDEANTRYTGPRHVEASTRAATAAGWHKKFALKLGQLGLELTQMVRSGLVLLSTSHLATAMLAMPDRSIGWNAVGSRSAGGLAQDVLRTRPL